MNYFIHSLLIITWIMTSGTILNSQIASTENYGFQTMEETPENNRQVLKSPDGDIYTYDYNSHNLNLFDISFPYSGFDIPFRNNSQTWDSKLPPPIGTGEYTKSTGL